MQTNNFNSLLLSILIPTKNGNITCLAAIESALNLQSENFEVVVQDCSDSNLLKEEIFNKFGFNKRIKYFYTDTLPSMTENWNLAISRANGKFICGIGDDDAVLPACMEVTKWMDKNNIQAVLGQFVTYIWKDAHIGSFSNGRLTHELNYSGDIFEVDVKKEFSKKAINCGFGYTDDLPNLYHGIIEKELIEEHRINCGHFLASTSFDVYNAMILSSYLNKSYYIDFPLTIRGVSGKSNGNAKNISSHFKEFKNLNIPEMLPDILSCEVSIAESTIIALQDLKKEKYIKKMNLAVVYGKSAALDLNNFVNYLNQYKSRKNSNNSLGDFFKYFLKFLKDRFNIFLKQGILKTIFFIIPNANTLLEKYTFKRKVNATDIGSATQMLKNYLTINSIAIKFDNEYKKHVSQKTPWD